MDEDLTLHKTCLSDPARHALLGLLSQQAAEGNGGKPTAGAKLLAWHCWGRYPTYILKPAFFPSREEGSDFCFALSHDATKFIECCQAYSGDGKRQYIRHLLRL